MKITLYLDGTRTSYTPPQGKLHERALDGESRQQQIYEAVNLLLRKLYPEQYLPLMSAGEQLEALKEQTGATPSGIINFALAYQMAYNEAMDVFTEAIWLASKAGEEAQISDAPMAEKLAAVEMARKIHWQLQQLKERL